MEIITSSFFSPHFFIAAIFTLLALLLSLRTVRSTKSPKSTDGTGVAPSAKKKACNCSCSCNGVVENHRESAESEMLEIDRSTPAVVVECGSGASMMEQLAPEITMHALSYLDYLSLCRLSMTNSLMRKVANDDNAWKALYHKDFTLEQDSVTPLHGWKAYYAATRAVVNVNAAFFNIIRERSLPAMSHFWLNADYVKCIHASGELFSGLYKLCYSQSEVWERRVCRRGILLSVIFSGITQ
ncbi:F-box protein SKIP8-like isoform X2 [Mangifera indica]|uniref:F-box protein SKIP8-like isoform X2 n=1 Tax=Mangifera indica TaxID=29780 RepID=UPI001CFA1921|nr:F-box protein SKIP8-like isoform X2 [Mangifera indica]